MRIFSKGDSALPRLLDSLHLSMAFASVWIYLIQNWGNDDIYDYIPWSVEDFSPQLEHVVTPGSLPRTIAVRSSILPVGFLISLSR